MIDRVFQFVVEADTFVDVLENELDDNMDHHFAVNKHIRINTHKTDTFI